MESALQLPGSFAVDAQSEFEMATARGDGSDVNGLAGPAYCSKSHAGNYLYVLLSGGRLYRVDGADFESCDVLKRFAQTAIPRIGT